MYFFYPAYYPKDEDEHSYTDVGSKSPSGRVFPLVGPIYKLSCLDRMSRN